MGDGSAAAGGEGTAVAPAASGVRARLPRAWIAGGILFAALLGWLGWRAWTDHRLKVRLREEIGRSIAARESAQPKPLAAVAADRDAGPVYDAASRAVKHPEFQRLRKTLLEMVAFEFLARKPGFETDLAANAKALELFGQAASLPEVRERSPRGWRPWEMASLLAAQSVLRLAEGDADGALRALLPMHRATRHRLASGLAPGYPESWFRRAMELSVAIVVHPALGEEAAREALGGLLTPGEARRIEDVEYGARRIGQERQLLDYLTEGGLARLRMRGIVPPSVLDRLLDRIRGRHLREAGSVPGARVLEQAWEALLRYDDIRALEGKARSEALAALDPAFPGGVYTDFVHSVATFDVLYARDASAYEAFLLLLRTALAVRIHEKRTGSPPASLAELVPGLLEAIPVDPVTGAPLAYSREPRGWSLVFPKTFPYWRGQICPREISTIAYGAAGGAPR